MLRATRSVVLRDKNCQDKVLVRFHGQYGSQKYLGQYLGGMAQSTVSKFLNMQPVDRETFIQICAALGIEDWRSVGIPYRKPADKTENSDSEELEELEESEKQEEIPTLRTPVHISTLEYPDGEQLALNSNFYVQRPPVEQQCFEEISKPAALICIKAPQKMGKSSLLVQIIQQAKNQGDATVVINFELGEKEFFSDLSKFLRWVCDRIILELTKDNLELATELFEKLDEHWKLAPRIGSKIAAKYYLERYLLPKINQPLTLALEEVDRLFEYPGIYKDFFGLLRSLHQEGRQQEIFKKLRLVIVHSTEAYVPMDINQSPFNVGLPIKLPEFDPEQMLDLAKRHQLEWSDTQVQQLRDMIGGHPYLVRLALYKIARGEITLSRFLETASTPSGIFSSHLRHLSLILTEQQELGAAMKEIINTNKPGKFSDAVRYKLIALGLVNLLNDEVIIRCKLYYQYFQNFYKNK
ncbi:AAA-like domain-containing protein [Nostoc spongiaeforme FACHB-130]|uniref:AAA-like domain-containing protein n=1 Tax=Nostoc spongiaeforme FACHB-130 TaxID=1357510 RepID=A0ABR8FX97_9NOSO|nr:AAA-like domain-containing protein [Nostoc spongiaeforme]MBD2595794.1 AAA-like domain-containing protein [Nostoc spongiaeforme FACHB-130]